MRGRLASLTLEISNLALTTAPPTLPYSFSWFTFSRGLFSVILFWQGGYFYHPLVDALYEVAGFLLRHFF